MKMNWKLGLIALFVIAGVVLIGIGVYRGFTTDDSKPSGGTKKKIEMLDHYGMSLTVFANDKEEDYEGVHQKSEKTLTLTSLGDEKTYSLGNPYEKVLEVLDQKESLEHDELKVDISMDKFLEKNPEYREVLPVQGTIACTYTIYEHKIESMECENSDTYFIFSFEKDPDI